MTSSLVEKSAKIAAEKIGLAFAVAFVGALLVASRGDLLTTQPYVPALDVALYAALLAAISTFALLALGIQRKLSAKWDAAIRTVLQFVQLLGGALLPNTVFHQHWSAALSFALTGTLPTVLKVLVAIHLPTQQASLVENPPQVTA